MRNREIHWIHPNKSAVLPKFRFYDREYQDAMNAHRSNPAKIRRAAAKIKRLLRAYRRHLRSLQGRLSIETYRKFSHKADPLFDSDLLALTVGDRLSTHARQRLRTSVEARFLGFMEDVVHVLKYADVQELQVSVPKVRWYDWGNGIPRIDSLLAHELTSAGARHVRHKLLFASGAHIDIVSRRVTWKTRIAERR